MARQLRLLEQLAEAGMGLARVAGVRATAAAGTEGIAEYGDRALAFGHVARAVRQTIGLEFKLRAERRAQVADPAADEATLRQLRLLQELAQIGLAVAKAPGCREAVPIFLKVARAVRQTVGAAVTLRAGRKPAQPGAAPAPTPPAEPAATPAEPEPEADPVEAVGDIARTLTETLDAFDEYYRFSKVPVADAVARIFKTLGVPVDFPAEDGAEPEPAAAPAAAGAAPSGDERAPARRDEPDRAGAGNRGPP
jgi:hypothetical protein